MKLRICSSFSSTSPYPGGNIGLPEPGPGGPWNGGCPAVGTNGGRIIGRPTGGGPRSPGAVEGGARIAGLGELVPFALITGSPHLKDINIKYE